MTQNYYRPELLGMRPLVELASCQGLTITGRVPNPNELSAPPTTNVDLNLQSIA